MTDVERQVLIERCDKSMFVTLTEDMLLAGQSDKGGWTAKQLELLGVNWPPTSGWKNSVRGRRMPGSTIAAFLRLRAKEGSCPPD